METHQLNGRHVLSVTLLDTTIPKNGVQRALRAGLHTAEMHVQTVELDQTPFAITQINLEDAQVDTRAFLMQTARKLVGCVKNRTKCCALIPEISIAKK